MEDTVTSTEKVAPEAIGEHSSRYLFLGADPKHPPPTAPSICLSGAGGPSRLAAGISGGRSHRSAALRGAAGTELKEKDMWEGLRVPNSCLPYPDPLVLRAWQLWGTAVHPAYGSGKSV